MNILFIFAYVQIVGSSIRHIWCWFGILTLLSCHGIPRYSIKIAISTIHSAMRNIHMDMVDKHWGMCVWCNHILLKCTKVRFAQNNQAITIIPSKPFFFSFMILNDTIRTCSLINVHYFLAIYDFPLGMYGNV